MPTDYRTGTSWRTHPKRVKLQRRLGAAAVLACMDLWGWAAEARQTGDLAGMDADDLAIAAGYDGDAAAWVAALVEFRLLDQGPTGLRIHDWADHNPFAATSAERSEHARKAAIARWGRASGMQGASKGNALFSSSGSVPDDPKPDLKPGRVGKPEAKPEKKKPDPLPFTISQLIAAFKRGAADRFNDDFDPKLAKPLTELIRRLHAGGKTLADVEAAGRYVATWTHPVGVPWLARDGSLWDAIGKARANGAGRRQQAIAYDMGGKP